MSRNWIIGILAAAVAAAALAVARRRAAATEAQPAPGPTPAPAIDAPPARVENVPVVRGANGRFTKLAPPAGVSSAELAAPPLAN